MRNVIRTWVVMEIIGRNKGMIDDRNRVVIEVCDKVRDRTG